MKVAMKKEVDSDFTVETLKAAQRGDRRSIEKTLKQFTPLVYSMANRYAFLASSYTPDDLFQEGMIGVCKGIDTFDFSKGTKPSTWINWQVRGAVLGAARKENKHPKFTESIDSLEQEIPANGSNDGIELEVNSTVKDLLLKRYGSEKSVGYKIVCHRFGLYGHKELSQTEIKEKFGLSKQVVSGCISRMKKSFKRSHPELANFISS